MQEEPRRIELDALLSLLKSAVGELLRLQDPDVFLSWMQSQAPERFPEIFSGLDERVARPLALELGRQIWNATPLPRNGFKPLPLPRPASPGDQDPPAIPGLTPELIGALIVALITDGAEGGAGPEEK